jgi:hypothetical protein
MTTQGDCIPKKANPGIHKGTLISSIYLYGNRLKGHTCFVSQSCLEDGIKQE